MSWSKTANFQDLLAITSTKEVEKKKNRKLSQDREIVKKSQANVAIPLVSDLFSE